MLWVEEEAPAEAADSPAAAEVDSPAAEEDLAECPVDPDAAAECPAAECPEAECHQAEDLPEAEGPPSEVDLAPASVSA